MKKRLNIRLIGVVIICVCLLIVLQYICQPKEGPSSFELPSEELKKEIELAWSNWDAEEKEYVNEYYERIYLGIHSDCVVWLNPFGNADISRTENIADTVFFYPYPFYIFVYHNGTFCSLQEAYDNRLLSKTQIAAIGKYYYEISGIKYQ